MARRFLPVRPMMTLPPEHEDPVNPEKVFQGSYSECLEYSLVLASQGIPSIYRQGDEGPWQLFVEPERFSDACLQLGEYLEENRETQTPMALPPLLLSTQPVWVLLIPFAITTLQFQNFFPGFSRQGMNDVALTLHGEWWRVFTALTLHGDGPHLAGNLVSAYFVLSLLAGRIPLTRIVPLLFLAAGLANFLVALTVQSDFRSLGFSTFVFASLGTLASIEWRLLPKEKTIGLFKRAEPVISASFLAIMMGLGENSDILAHLYGFLCGLFAGVIPGKRSIQGYATTWGSSDAFALASVYMGIALSWKMALGHL